MISRRAFTFLSLALLVAAAGWLTLTRPAAGSAAGEPALAQPGFPAPDFELTALDGSQVHLSDLQGQAVILNLWASWCPPCRAEMPALNCVYHDYAEKGLVVIGLNLTSQDSRAAAEAFAQENQLDFPILLDETGEAEAHYRTDALPTTFFISRAGIVQERIVGGPLPEALLRAQAERLLAVTP
jgi:cytochrome c biogenesis protein CcmG/thiol:disulfide interchange protein DsbE